MSKGNRGTPLLSTVVKKIAISKDWKGKKKEQDQIVKYLMHQTQNAHFNYIVTRPSGVIWDRPSRKKLAASKSVSRIYENISICSHYWGRNSFSCFLLFFFSLSATRAIPNHKHRFGRVHIERIKNGEGL